MSFTNINWENIWAMILDKAIAFVIVSLLFFIVYKLCNSIVKRLFKQYLAKSSEDNQRIVTLSKMTRSGLHYLTIILYVYTVLYIFGIPVGSILTGAGLFGAALAFSARDLVADLINGFFLIVEHQVNVGDRVAFSNLNIEGEVKLVGIRMITLTADDGSTVFVPNRNVIALQNFSRGKRTVHLDVPVNAETLNAVKAKVIAIDEAYEAVSYVGIITVEENLFIRSDLTAEASNLATLKRQIMDEYFEA
ncbi:mechanosensitive ion channel family protein [Lactococcus termiticola]|uniref:Small-conductance mechanosensitive channel n=1 Tax=Lactococcus termiticola TaxID=2169526 RepID=A0A2R5HKA3_9LACT|nr:mechanosensitive ion channel domain-containing protein [Lactococcus termiticola]GBG97230.1 small-conductance mechanosensitive channel [Lactococcus termiticola]